MTTNVHDTRALASRNPATGEVVGEVPMTPTAEIAAVVARARKAQRAWGALEPAERAARLGAAGEALLERATEIGRTLSAEMGKPLREGIGEVKGCARGLQGFAEEVAAAVAPERREDDRTISTIFHEPFGVCAAITPWNFPVGMPHSLVVPGLVAGNAVILKPSEKTPLSADAYARVLMEALPDDVLQVIHGDERQGRALVEAEVDLVAFTGSREAGKSILGEAAKGLKRVILELGGKDPLIVLDDADLDAAAEFAVRNGFRNAGQVCVSTERVYVDRAIRDDFLEAMERKVGALKVGPADEEGVDVGPMIDAGQRDHVLGHIEDALEKGARIAIGGKGHRDNFVMPTVLTEVEEAMPVMRDETFGPVVCVVDVESADEAVARANDTPFGLGAVVFGGDVERATAVARRIEAGMVGVNKSCGGASGSPWVGAKESGYGFHGSVDGHRQFTQPRVVSVGKAR